MMNDAVLKQIEALVGRKYGAADDVASGDAGSARHSQRCDLNDDRSTNDGNGDDRSTSGPGAGGFDCMTLAREIYRISGRVFPMPETYHSGNIPPAILLTWSRHWETVEAPETLDIVGFVDHAGDRHVGVYLPGARIIHASKRHGVAIHRIARLRPWITGIYRLKA